MAGKFPDLPPFHFKLATSVKIVVIEVSYVNFPKIYCYKGSFLNGKVQFKPSQNGIGF